MQLFDPERMAEAKAQAGRHTRIIARVVILATLPVAYYFGYWTGYLAAAGDMCRKLLDRFA